jgi:hypothetical protein
MVERMAPMWEARTALTQNPGRLDEIVREGSRKAGEVARRTLEEVTDAMRI